MRLHTRWALALLIAFNSVPVLAGNDRLVYIGSYTGEKSKGISVARFDPKTGKLTAPELAAETRNPSFLAVHPNAKVLYAVGEISDFNGQRAGAVKAYGISRPSGALILLNQQPSGGTGPTHLAVDHKGRWLLVANYGSGSIAALPINPDGTLAPAAAQIQHQGSSVNPKRQAGPHAHHITPDPANRFVLVCDLGLDKVLVYRLSGGKRDALAPNDPPFASLRPGAGPRHLAFSPDGEFVFVINELNSTITSFKYDAGKGLLQELGNASTLPESFTGESTCAEIQVHPSGKFVYGSNRGHDSIAVFSLNRRTGQLAAVEHEPTQGKTPRHFALDPSGRWLLAENQATDTIAVFEVNAKTGALAPTGHMISTGAPVCLVFVPARR